MIKPNTTEAMSLIIAQIRESFPFNLSKEELCSNCSSGCALKLLEYMDSELSDWEYRLENNEIPSFADIQKLSKTSLKIYRVLESKQLVAPLG